MLRNAIGVFLLIVILLVGYQYGPALYHKLDSSFKNNWDLTDKSYIYFLERVNDNAYVLNRQKKLKIDKVAIDPESVVGPGVLVQYIGRKVVVEGRFMEKPLGDTACVQRPCKDEGTQTLLWVTSINVAPEDN